MTPIKQISVLLVEDDSFIANIIRESLEEAGYNVLYTESGETARAILAKDNNPPIGMVLLDLLLPDIQGFDVLKWMKSQPKIADIPVLVISNLGDQKALDDTMTLGATDYIIKANSTPGEIMERIRQILEGAPSKT